MDEAQFEVTKGLVKWKKFESEEDLKEFQKENPTWAGPLHSDKGHFLGNSILDSILLEAIDEASKHFKLKMTLKVEALYGVNWKTTH